MSIIPDPRLERLQFLELVLGKLQWYNRSEMLLEYYELRKQVDPSWTVTKTTLILGVSKPNLDIDIRLARACRKDAKIKAFKSREEAFTHVKALGL